MNYSTIKIFFLTLAAASLLSLTACDQTLDKDPAQSIPAEDAFDSAQNIEAALNGVYDGLQLDGVYGGNAVMFADVGADIVNWEGSFEQYTQAQSFNIRADNSFVLQLWQDHYEVINRANAIIENTTTDVEGLDQDDVDRIIGQAKFIRADMYFNLVRWYGEPFDPDGNNDQPGVPIRTTPTLSAEDATPAPRAPVSAVYDQILADLTDATSRLDVNSNAKRAGLQAANALLSEVRLYRGEYGEAEALATTVINDDNYELSGTVVEPYQNEQSPGIVFATSFSAIDNSGVNDHPTAFYLASNLGGRGEAFPLRSSGGIFTKTADEDLRATVGEEPDGEFGFFLFNDRVRTNKWTSGSLADDAIHTRIAEVLLTRAEARARQGDEEGAREDVNRIRNRAGLGNVDPSLSGQALIDEIIFQRGVELAFEGERRHTLDRVGKPISNTDVTDLPADDPQRLFPIPEDVIETNTEISQSDQNPGF